MSARPSILIASLAASLAHAGGAAAQAPRPLQVAGPVEPAPARIAAAPRRERVDLGLVNFDAGTAMVPSRAPGAYGRIGTAYVSAFDARRPSFAWGFWGGWEGWGAGGAWGFGFPLVVYVGVKSPKALAAVGGGANLFAIGELDKKFGGGLLQPRAQARLGFRMGKVLFTGTGEVQYGWGWGHPAAVVLMTGISAGIVFQEETRR